MVPASFIRSYNKWSQHRMGVVVDWPNLVFMAPTVGRKYTVTHKLVNAISCT